MPAIASVDPAREFFRIHPDRRIDTAGHRPGPPERIDGHTLGIVSMAANAPHGGEMHPDGDEVLYVISGRIRVTGDSAPEAPMELGPGQACIVPAGEWHRVDVIEPVQLVHLTPGPGGEHRPPP